METLALIIANQLGFAAVITLSFLSIAALSVWGTEIREWLQKRVSKG